MTTISVGEAGGGTPWSGSIGRRGSARKGGCMVGWSERGRRRGKGAECVGVGKEGCGDRREEGGGRWTLVVLTPMPTGFRLHLTRSSSCTQACERVAGDEKKASITLSHGICVAVANILP